MHFLREPVGEWVLLDAETADRRGRRRAGALGAQRPVGTGGSRRAGAARRATLIRRVAGRDERDRAAAAGARTRADGRERRRRPAATARSTAFISKMREARAEAAAHAAAERDPRVGAGGLLEEALGAERERVRVDVLAGVHRAGCSARTATPAGQVVAGDARTAPSAAAGRRGRPGRSRSVSLHDRVEVVLVAASRSRCPRARG